MLSAPGMAGWNAALRFGSEVVGLVGPGAGGGTMAREPQRGALVLALPLLGATIWGIFRVQDDPGSGLVAVPGLVRLSIEMAVLGGGVAGLWVGFGRAPGLAFLALTLLHYATSFERVRWLLER